MSKPVILCDMDDVLEELLAAWCEWLNYVHNLSVSPEDVTEWDMAKAYPTLSKAEVFEPIYFNDFWRCVMPKYGAASIVQQLIDEGYPFYVVTASSYKTIEAKLDWALFRPFPFLSYRQVITAHDKSMIKGDVIIDDGVHNLGGERKLRLLMDAPHNRSFDAASSGAIRVFNWQDIYREIKEFEAKEECV